MSNLEFSQIFDQPATGLAPREEKEIKQENPYHHGCGAIADGWPRVTTRDASRDSTHAPLKQSHAWKSRSIKDYQLKKEMAPISQDDSMFSEASTAVESVFDSTFKYNPASNFAPSKFDTERNIFSFTEDNNKFTILLYPKKLTIFPSKFSKEGEFRSFAYITVDEMRSRIKPRGGEWDMLMGPATVRGSVYPQLLLKLINAMHLNVSRLEIEVVESDFENGARIFKLTNQKDFC